MVNQTTTAPPPAPGPPFAVGFIYFLITYVFINVVFWCAMWALRDRHPIKNRQYALVLISGFCSYVLLLKFLFEMLALSMPGAVAYTIIYAIVMAFLFAKVIRSYWLVANFKARQTVLNLNFGISCNLKWIETDYWVDIANYIRIYAISPFVSWGIGAVILFNANPNDLLLWVFIWRIIMTAALTAASVWCFAQVPSDRTAMRKEIIITASLVLGDTVLSFLTFLLAGDALVIGRTIFLALYLCIMGISANSTVYPVCQALYLMSKEKSGDKYEALEDALLKNSRVLAVKTYARSAMFTIDDLVKKSELKDRIKKIHKAAGEGLDENDVAGGLYVGHPDDDEAELMVDSFLATEAEAKYTHGVSMLSYHPARGGSATVSPISESTLEGHELSIRIPYGEGFGECKKGACLFLRIAGHSSTGRMVVQEKTKMFQFSEEPKFNYYGFSLPSRMLMTELVEIKVSIWQASSIYLCSKCLGEFTHKLQRGAMVDEVKSFDGATNGKVRFLCEVSEQSLTDEKARLKELYKALDHVGIRLKACGIDLKGRMAGLAAVAREKAAAKRAKQQV